MVRGVQSVWACQDLPISDLMDDVSEWTRQPASVAPETPSDLSGKMHGTSLTTLTVTFSRE